MIGFIVTPFVTVTRHFGTPWDSADAHRCTFVAGHTGHGHTTIGIGIQWTVTLGAMHREAFRHLRKVTTWKGKGYFFGRVGKGWVFLKAWKNDEE